MEERTVIRENETHYVDNARANTQAGFNLSWGSIFAGLVTFIALLFSFSLVGTALGFGQFDPTQPNPFEGVGTSQGIWWAIALILSFLGAGFVSGMASRRVGMLHGFVTWATSLIGIMVLLVWIASSALMAAGNVVGTVADTAGQAVGTVAESVGTAVTNGVDALVSNIDVSQEDINNLQTTVHDVLEDTDIPELQPEYLQEQLDGATNDITEAGQAIVTNPGNYQQIITDLTDTLTSRLDNIAENVDEEALANAIEENTDLNQNEADQAVENIIEGYNLAASEARTQIQNAADGIDQFIQDVEVQVGQIQENLAQTTEEASNVISSGSWWAFAGVLFGAILSTVGGSLGVNFIRKKTNEAAV